MSLHIAEMLKLVIDKGDVERGVMEDQLRALNESQ